MYELCIDGKSCEGIVLKSILLRCQEKDNIQIYTTITADYKFVQALIKSFNHDPPLSPLDIPPFRRSRSDTCTRSSIDISRVDT